MKERGLCKEGHSKSVEIEKMSSSGTNMSCK